MLFRKSPGGSMPVCRRNLPLLPPSSATVTMAVTLSVYSREPAQQLRHACAPTDGDYPGTVSSRLSLKQRTDNLHMAEGLGARYKRAHDGAIQKPYGRDRQGQTDGKQQAPPQPIWEETESQDVYNGGKRSGTEKLPDEDGKARSGDRDAQYQQ